MTSDQGDLPTHVKLAVLDTSGRGIVTVAANSQMGEISGLPKPVAVAAGLILMGWALAPAAMGLIAEVNNE